MVKMNWRRMGSFLQVVQASNIALLTLFLPLSLSLSLSLSLFSCLSHLTVFISLSLLSVSLFLSLLLLLLLQRNESKNAREERRKKWEREFGSFLGALTPPPFGEVRHLSLSYFYFYLLFYFILFFLISSLSFLSLLFIFCLTIWILFPPMGLPIFSLLNSLTGTFYYVDLSIS